MARPHLNLVLAYPGLWSWPDAPLLHDPRNHIPETTYRARLTCGYAIRISGIGSGFRG